MAKTPRSRVGDVDAPGAPPPAGRGAGNGATAAGAARPLIELVGAALPVQCLDGAERPYRDLDCAASSPATVGVSSAVSEFLPLYSSVHRGAGFKSRASTAAYEAARQRILEHCDRAGGRDIAIVCRNTTEAINHLAYRLGLEPGDVVLTTLGEHHANLLPWARVAHRRYVECGRDGTFDVDAVIAGMDEPPRPRLLAITGASNVTGWQPPIDEICEAAHERGIPIALDAAQLAPHHPVPQAPEFVAWSGHKMYAPFGAGTLVGPRDAFATGEPFLAGGGAVDLVDLDEVVWTEPPEREEAGSPNVVGAVALGAAIDELRALGWDAITAHEATLSSALRRGLAAIDGVTLLGPSADTPTLAVASFTVQGMHHGLVAARLSAEWGVGVRHGCFCAHPYLLRLLGLGREDIAAARAQVMANDRRHIPGAVRASCGLGTTVNDVETLLSAVRSLAAGEPPPVPYVQDPVTGDFHPETARSSWWTPGRAAGGGCARG